MKELQPNIDTINQIVRLQTLKPLLGHITCSYKVVSLPNVENQYEQDDKHNVREEENFLNGSLKMSTRNIAQ